MTKRKAHRKLNKTMLISNLSMEIRVKDKVIERLTNMLSENSVAIPDDVTKVLEHLYGKGV